MRRVVQDERALIRYGRGIVNPGQRFVEPLHRAEQCEESTLVDGLDHEPIAVPVDRGLAARQREFGRDADRLVAADAKEPDAPMAGPGSSPQAVDGTCLILSERHEP